MIKDNKSLLLTAALFFVGVVIYAFYLLSNHWTQIQERSGPSIKFPIQTSWECGIQNCHGLEIKCGLVDQPQVCDAMYAAGDNCRQYVSCKKVSGRCELEKTQKFDSCKACVEKCEIDYGNDPEGVFECEGKCTE